MSRERDGIVWTYDPGSRLADIHIEKDRNRWIIGAKRGRDGIDLRGMVDHQHDGRAAVQRHQSAKLVAAHNGGGDEHVRHAGRTHILRLAQRGAAYADCAGLALPAGDVRRLVGLCMWAQRDPGSARGGLHALDVGIERSRLDHERRSFDVAQHGIVWIKRGQWWPYSMTSSARASSIGEISRPSALAVFKFTAVWKCDSCRMGVSPALAPFAT